MADVITWRTLTELRGIAKKHGVVRSNTKRTPELLEELAQMGIDVAEEPVAEEPVAEEPVEEQTEQPEATTTDADTQSDAETVDAELEVVADEEPEEPEEPEAEPAPKPTESQVMQLTRKVEAIEQELDRARKELSAAIAAEAEAKKPKSFIELLNEQRRQDAINRSKAPVDPVKVAQAELLASRRASTRQQRLANEMERLKNRI